MRVKKIILWLVVFLCVMPVLGIADAPVVDISSTQSNVSPDNYQPTQSPLATTTATADLSVAQSELTANERLIRLEQRVTNLTNMNLPQQISNLQQELAQLRGQLQVQAHNLKLLTDQQRNFYRDLNQRLSQLRSGSKAKPPIHHNTKSKVNATPVMSNARLKDSQAYQAAFELLSKKRYTQSKVAFQKYLKNYPNGQYVSNAHYWLGEIFSSQKKLPAATHEFQTIIDKFPKSSKVPDAKLKLAILHAREGKINEARRELQKIKRQHPNSTAAQLANIRLQQLKSSYQSSNYSSS